jgi:Na+(H+)/acetate symporter ActP
MLLLQIVNNNTADAVRKAWEISPSSIFGFVLAVMLLAIIALSSGLVYVVQKYIAISQDATMGLNAAADRIERVEGRLEKIETLIIHP